MRHCSSQSGISPKRSAFPGRRGRRAQDPRYLGLQDGRVDSAGVTIGQDSIRRHAPTVTGHASVAFGQQAGQTGTVTTEQMEMISTDPRVMHGQAVITGTRVPVSVILDCLASGLTPEEITAEYPTVPAPGVRAAAAYGAALAREELLPIPQSR